MVWTAAAATLSRRISGACRGTTVSGMRSQAIGEAGYAVRHLPGQGLPQALRITIGTPQQMDDIAAVLRRLCGEDS